MFFLGVTGRFVVDRVPLDRFLSKYFQVTFVVILPVLTVILYQHCTHTRTNGESSVRYWGALDRESTSTFLCF